MAGLLKVSATATAGFYRAGQFWPHAGRVVDPDALGEAVMARLRAEPNLHITPASSTEAEAAQADALRDQVRSAIGTLEPGDFTEAGAPKVEAVRRALKGAKGITADLVAEVWAEVKPAE